MKTKAVNTKWILITGMMGVGKSTFGHNLALKMSLPFWDMDLIIEQKTKRKIPQLFSDLGEHGFRRWERILFRLTIKREFGIMACGGGLLCQSANKSYIRKNNKYIDVWLNAPVEEIIRRVKSDFKKNNRNERPLLNKNLRKTLNELIRKRGFDYYDALIHIVSIGKNNTSDELIKKIQLLGKHISSTKYHGRHIKLR